MPASYRISIQRRGNLVGLGLVATALALPSLASGQADQMPAVLGTFGVRPGDSVNQASAANLYVSIREPNGLPVTESVTVSLNCPLKGVALNGSTKDTALAQFNNIPAGDCVVEATAPGYKTAKERAVVTESIASRNQYVYIYLHSASETDALRKRPPVSLDVLKEMDRGTEALSKNHLDDARRHLLKAAERGPQNPDVQYLLGSVDSRQNNPDSAAAHFEKALSFEPTHPHALLALGELHLRNKKYPEAAATLERAVQVNTLSYRAQFSLGAAYYQRQQFDKAKPHAQRAIALGGDKIPMAHVLLGDILAGEGDREGARHELEVALHDFPKDAATIAAAKSAIEDLDRPASTASSKSHSNSDFTAPAAEDSIDATSGPLRAWGPPDVDGSQPGVAADVPCSAEEIVRRTAQTSTEQLENFEKFMASEHIDHEEVDRNGNPGHRRSRDFSYLVFIDRDKGGQIFLKENRDGGTGIDSFPTSLATVGLLGLGVDVFHPGFASALEFQCEGLGQWRGKAAWVMHFRQKAGQRSYLRLWETQRKTVEIPLKGRVWVAASSYEVLHIDTDLRNPMSDLELTRDHLSIDYGPVAFQNGKTEMWLPWSADMYLELHHHRYHHRHTLSNYSLFAVDTNNTIGAPKGADAPAPEAP